MFFTRKQVPVASFPPEWIAAAVPRYTFDTPSLEARFNHNVFVCDSLMNRRSQHEELGVDKLFEGIAMTRDRFSFWRRDLGKYSSAVPMVGSVEKAVTAPIRGELWSIATPTMFKLDELYENGVQFQRVRVQLDVPVSIVNRKNSNILDRSAFEFAIKQPMFLERVSAFMYIGCQDYWEPMFSSGTKLSTATKFGEKLTERVDRNGNVYAASKIFTPHNPLLKPYHFFDGQPPSSRGVNL